MYCGRRPKYLCIIYIFLRHICTPTSHQESFLAPEFKQIVKYCQSSSASDEGVSVLLEEEAGELSQCHHVISEERRNEPMAIIKLFLLFC